MMEAVALSPAEQVRQWQDNYRRLSLSPVRRNVVPIERVRPTLPPAPIVRDILYIGSHPAATKHSPDSVQRIKYVVATKHGLPVGEINGVRRCKRVVAARWEALREVYEAYPEWGIARIGRAFSMDHTSVIHALRKMGVRP